MSFVYNSNTILKANRVSKNEVRAECTVLSNDREMTGWIITDVNNLIIKRAGWEVFRSPEKNNGHYALPQLEGISAYMDSGPALKRELGGKDQELVRELISDCIRAVIQAETYFIKERGYESPQMYEELWDKEVYINSCRFFSHLDKREQSWFEYLGDDSSRIYNLFNRIKTVNVSSEQNGDYIVNNTFSDSFHQLSSQINVDGEGVVKSIEGEYTRAPGQMCFQNSQHLPSFIGAKLPEMSKKDIAILAGGSEGCDHLVSLLYDASRALAVLIKFYLSG